MKLPNRFGMAAIGLTVSMACAMAQPGDPEAGEISVYGGTSLGVGNHPNVGSNFGRAFSRYCIALIDMNYTPMGTRTLHNYPGVVINRSRLYDFNFSMHIRVPVNKRWEPFAILGGGFLYNTFQRQILQPNNVATLSGSSYGTFGFQTGAGARYYAAEDWGIRGEYRYTFSNHNFSRILVGAFYEFNGDFPFRIRHGSRRRHADPY